MRHFTATRRKARQIDHDRLWRTRFDLARAKEAVAEIECHLKAKSLELLLPLEALVFSEVDQSDNLQSSINLQFFNVAFTVMVGIEPSAREMMQPVLVFSTCCWNVALSTFGTTASTVSSTRLIRNPLSSLFRCTSALVFTLVGVKPADASELASAMEKQPACAAPSRSSGLAPLPCSKRDANE